MSKTILITGASRGFGKIWAEALLQNGHKVAVTARDTKALKDLKEKYSSSVLPLRLDVNSREECFAVVNEVYDHFEKIDVVINNAGYGLFGAIEETTEQQARQQMETNFFGLLWITQAVLPIMRKQQSGHIIQVSSIVGLITFPVLGLYNASKFAVEGLSDTLATEVASFGIKVTLVEPNGYSTDWAGASAVQTKSIEAYNPVKETFQASATPDFFGNPEATADAIITLINSDNPPLRLLLGKVAYPAVKQAYEARLAEWESWKEISANAHGK